MSTYAIGDIQGCFDQLQSLLTKIQFNPDADQLWLVGDLVNRGPKSLEVLRFIKSLGNRAITVLGNHDIHLLARFYGNRVAGGDDTLDQILQAPDADKLMDWLRCRPLAHFDTKLNYLMVHAGVAPDWSLPQVLALAKEVELVLQQQNPGEFLDQLFAKQTPDCWANNLAGVDRIRCIVNYLTRVRFCNSRGKMDLANKTDQANLGFSPWFSIDDRKMNDTSIIFGHWASLQAKIGDAINVYALDTGCVWGGKLTAMRLQDQELFSV